MTIHFQKEKHLDIDSVRRTDSGDIEVLFPKYDTAASVYLIEYELEWYVVIEDSVIEDGIPEIERFHSYLIENQLDVYRLNASL